MKIKCEYCGAFIEDTDEKCEFCGAVNSHLVRAATGIPKTIEELLAFAKEKNLPLKDMRFFIGEDTKESRAFGIYYDEKSENYVVYKNKDDGSRAVRYEGKDESYAVNEIYQKMKSEVLNQRAINIAGKNYDTSTSTPQSRSRSGNSGSKRGWFTTAIIVLAFIFMSRFGGCFGASYSSGGLLDSSPSAYESDYDSYDNGGSSWWDSDYDDDDSWDSGDWDWGSDSWDSGGSDWDSDW